MVLRFDDWKDFCSAAGWLDYIVLFRFLGRLSAEDRARMLLPTRRKKATNKQPQKQEQRRLWLGQLRIPPIADCAMAPGALSVA
jgi:hypothetical protein